jgi:hypothetical protein
MFGLEVEGQTCDDGVSPDDHHFDILKVFTFLTRLSQPNLPKVLTGE